MTTTQDYLKRLERRADHLSERIVENRALGKDCSYDRAELSALLWAIRQLTHLEAGLPPYVDRL